MGRPGFRGPARDRVDRIPAAGNFRYGTTGRNSVTGPGIISLDASLNKKFLFAEGRYLEFRTEVFNLFNRAQYGNPVNARQTSTFGRNLVTASDGATGTGTSRQLQFMLRLNF